MVLQTAPPKWFGGSPAPMGQAGAAQPQALSQKRIGFFWTFICEFTDHDVSLTLVAGEGECLCQVSENQMSSGCFLLSSPVVNGDGAGGDPVQPLCLPLPQTLVRKDAAAGRVRGTMAHLAAG